MRDVLTYSKKVRLGNPKKMRFVAFDLRAEEVEDCCDGLFRGC